MHVLGFENPEVPVDLLRVLRDLAVEKTLDEAVLFGMHSPRLQSSSASRVAPKAAMSSLPVYRS